MIVGVVENIDRDKVEMIGTMGWVIYHQYLIMWSWKNTLLKKYDPHIVTKEFLVKKLQLDLDVDFIDTIMFSLGFCGCRYLKLILIQ